MELLLLSNSRTAEGWLTGYLPAIRELAGDAKRAVFIPFAAVTVTWEKYTSMLQEAFAPLSLEVNSFEKIETADLIIVGGGNSFHLLHHVRRHGLLEPIRERVRAGARYLGWSAGANLACPTIKTTNDMPVIDPGGLEALGLVGFQINPHYTNLLPPGLQAETREQRLLEFAQVNPGLPAIGLPEGDWLRVAGGEVTLGGPHPAVVFRHGEAPRAISAADPAIRGLLPAAR